MSNYVWIEDIRRRVAQWEKESEYIKRHFDAKKQELEIPRLEAELLAAKEKLKEAKFCDKSLVELHELTTKKAKSLKAEIKTLESYLCVICRRCSFRPHRFPVIPPQGWGIDESGYICHWCLEKKKFNSYSVSFSLEDLDKERYARKVQMESARNVYNEQRTLLGHQEVLRQIESLQAKLKEIEVELKNSTEYELYNKAKKHYGRLENNYQYCLEKCNTCKKKGFFYEYEEEGLDVWVQSPIGWEVYACLAGAAAKCEDCVKKSPKTII